MGVDVDGALAEARAHVALAVPVTLASLCNRARDLISLGFVGADAATTAELAGAALASTIANVTGNAVVVGLVSALVTLGGQAYGRGARRRGVGVGAARARVLRGDGDGDGDRLAVRRGGAVGVEFRRGDREELRGVLARIAPGVVRVRGERVRAGVVAGAGVDAAHRVRGRRGDGVTRAGVPVLSKDGVRCGRAGVRDEREHEFGVRGERDVRAVEKKSERMVSRTRRGFGGAQRRVRVEGVL
jgi:hypothetical protein